jgi:hypothetical protein
MWEPWRLKGTGESAISVTCWVTDEVAAEEEGDAGAAGPRRLAASMQRKKRTQIRGAGGVGTGKNGMREPGRSAASAQRKKGTGEPRRRAGGGVRWRAQEEAVAGAGVVARGRVWWWVGVTFIWGSWAR